MTLKLPYTVSGIVIHGFGRGHSLLGFPTANISTDYWQEITEAEYGVYCGTVDVEGYPTKAGVISIGKNPTFDNKKPTFEVHILNFRDDIYDQKITVELMEKIRPMLVFKDINGLITQINKDIEYAKTSAKVQTKISCKN
ncbi:Riboflavin kinase [Histomonas meleagridis]|uniref:Riboflavin kinase n=1 Tax=Histomonas meleagridis TaxID=135588 RepID=UPI003559BB62|nr:Riboflavin kinase [Histomonas meleagridis]KAH0807109.1 Riboflavin kinase [Histomonas meleagridis]